MHKNSVEDVKPLLVNLKKEHTKANHFCYAYRLGTDGNVFRSSDDGEPSNSAGKPILAQIDSKQVTNVLVVVVRYFGGYLLGVAGLVHAYKTATALALQLTPIIQVPIEVSLELQVDYTHLNDLLVFVKQEKLTVVRQDVQLFCTVVLGVPINRASEVEHALAQLHFVQIVTPLTSTKKSIKK
jgi:uncharacterized YigZ family protein